MNRKILFWMLIVLYFFNLSHADEKILFHNSKFEIKADRKKYNLFPTFNTDIYLSKHLNLNLYIDSSYFNEQTSISGFNGSYVNRSYNQTIADIGFSYSNDNLSIGFGGNYYKIDKNEFGYLKLNTNFVLFENKIKYEIYRLFINFEFKKRSDFYKFHINSKVFYPSNTYLKQETSFRPLLDTTAKYKSNLNLKTSFRVDSTLIFPFKLFNLGFSVIYEYLPTKYTLKALDERNGSYFYITDNIDHKQTNIRYGIFLLISKLKNSPYIGYYKEQLKTEIENSKETTTTDYVAIGFLF